LGRERKQIGSKGGDTAVADNAVLDCLLISRSTQALLQAAGVRCRYRGASGLGDGLFARSKARRGRDVGGLGEGEESNESDDRLHFGCGWVEKEDESSSE